MERVLCAGLFMLMTAVMFVSVAHRIFSRQEGRLAAGLIKLGLLPASQLTGWVPALIQTGLVFGLSVLAFRTVARATPFTVKAALGLGALTTLGLCLAVKAILVVLPNGLVWGPAVGLSCMLWLGFLGASLATHEKRHLALEMGEKIWPAGLQGPVRILAMMATAALCLFLLLLALLSVAAHHQSWVVNHLTGNLLPTQIPKWVVFLVFPYGFFIMTFRFLGQGLGLLVPPSREGLL